MRAFHLIRFIAPPGDYVVPLATNRFYGGNLRDRDDTLYLLQYWKNGRAATIPVLREMLRGTNSSDQSKSLAYLCGYGKEAQPAVLDVVDWISRNDLPGPLRDRAFIVLQRVGVGASNAIPFLQARMKGSPDADTRMQLAYGILSINPQQVEARNLLLAMAKDEVNPVDAIKALAYLKKVDSGTGALRAFFSEEAKAESLEIWLPAIRNLRLIAGTRPTIPLVESKLDSADAEIRLNASLYLVCYEPTQKRATDQLTEFVRDDYWGGVTIRQTPRLPKVPQEITAALHEIAASNLHKNQQFASEALRSIQAAESNRSDYWSNKP